MLGKLLKYELKATSRVFIPLYIAILVVSIVNGLSLNLEILNIQGLATIVLMCLFISLFVITIVVTIQRFNKNLLKDEGYLMFTLPVNSIKIFNFINMDIFKFCCSIFIIYYNLYDTNL